MFAEWMDGCRSNKGVNEAAGSEGHNRRGQLGDLLYDGEEAGT
jgi:hypothetical protein